MTGDQTIDEIAKIEKCSRRTASRKIQLHEIPWVRVGRNLYRRINLDQEDFPKESTGIISFSKWKAFKMKEDALKAQRERQVFEADLLKKDLVIREVGQAFHVVKTKLMTIPTSISGIVAIEEDAAVCKEIIEGSIREILAELSSTVGTQFGAVGIPETPAQVNG